MVGELRAPMSNRPTFKDFPCYSLPLDECYASAHHTESLWSCFFIFETATIITTTFLEQKLLAISVLRDWAMAKGTFCNTNVGLSSVTGIWWAVAMDVAKHSVMHRAVPTRKRIWHKPSMVPRFRKLHTNCPAIDDAETRKRNKIRRKQWGWMSMWWLKNGWLDGANE